MDYLSCVVYRERMLLKSCNNAFKFGASGQQQHSTLSVGLGCSKFNRKLRSELQKIGVLRQVDQFWLLHNLRRARVVRRIGVLYFCQKLGAHGQATSARLSPKEEKKISSQKQNQRLVEYQLERDDEMGPHVTRKSDESSQHGLKLSTGWLACLFPS